MQTREIAGHRWYVETVAYPSALMARRAWERAERKLLPGGGDEGIGITRLAPNPAGGEPTGNPGGHAVAIVTLDEKVLRKAQRLLSDGTPFEATVGLVDALIARRARVVVDHAGEKGRLIIRRPEERGAQFDQFGHVREPDPGQG